MTPERKARVEMDALLAAAGMHVCDVAQAVIHPAIDVAIREFPLSSGFGLFDYLFHVNGRSRGLIKVRQHGAMLAGVELQSDDYAQSVADVVSVNYDVYRIQTEVSQRGAKVDKGFGLATQNKVTRRKSARQLDNDFEYQPQELDRVMRTLFRAIQVEVDINIHWVETMRQATLARQFRGRSL